MGYEIVVIGTSLGGLIALGALLETLPVDFTLPVAVVQHRSPESADILIRELRRHSRLRLQEPQDREVIVPGHIYIAPADYHLLVENGEFRLSTEGPVNYARPSIDVLFETAADAYGGSVIGILLTGASHDGAHGAVRIQQRGGLVIVQSLEEAECAVMPRAALLATRTDHVLSIREIGSTLVQLQTAAS